MAEKQKKVEQNKEKEKIKNSWLFHFFFFPLFHDSIWDAF